MATSDIDPSNLRVTLPPLHTATYLLETQQRTTASYNLRAYLYTITQPGGYDTTRTTPTPFLVALASDPDHRLASVGTRAISRAPPIYEIKAAPNTADVPRYALLDAGSSASSSRRDQTTPRPLPTGP
jgi:hypothetical protein